MFTVRNINLNKLPAKSKVWDRILFLTVPGWRAVIDFKRIRGGLYPNGIFFLRAVYHQGKMIAWGFEGHFSPIEEPVLWLYTMPEYRKEGIQKNYVLPYFNRKKVKYCVWMKDEKQKKAFSLLKNKIDVSGQIPVDLSENPVDSKILQFV